MDGNQGLEPLSNQLKVGDVLELTLIDENCTPKQKVEIPIACKHVTKSHIFLDFLPHTLSVNFEKSESELNNDWLDLTIDHMDIFDPEKAYIAACDKGRSWSNQLVMWKKKTSHPNS
ncbi:hypothetical protein [Acaryochloris marina]|uniref:hypothetical protein n=1 Tax=Acaryochloris marina TaxID=155978 RepID=UPI001BAFA288|nr:hypothetical protein [Acaryochloris marina]QUY44809.1 hypothetical protein I1H34_12410 [Acaryochloris marina S15]